MAIGILFRGGNLRLALTTLQESVLGEATDDELIVGASPRLVDACC